MPSPTTTLAAFSCAQGRTNDALAQFQRAVELEPAFVEARFNLGGILLAQGRLDDALSQYEKVAQLKPGLPQAHVMLARLAAAFAQAGRIDQAVCDSRQCPPTGPRCPRNLSRRHFGIATAIVPLRNSRAKPARPGKRSRQAA